MSSNIFTQLLGHGPEMRGSQGAWTIDGPPSFKECPSFPRVDGNTCRCMAFSPDGTHFALCDGRSVRVVNVTSGKVVSEILKPRTSYMQFSPKNSVLATWEPYMVTKDQPANTPNLNVWNAQNGQLLKGFVQKKQEGWAPQWSRDEGICARNVNNEVQFYEENNFDAIVNRLHLQKVQDFSLPPQGGKPYHVAAYVPGVKGQPSFVRVFRYPNFGGPGAALANKSFYKADKHEMIWNNKGSSLLVLTATDTSADSYYGEQGLHYVGIDGESCLVPRAKNGPVYHVEWNPKSTEFCVVYGFMPAKATLFNLKCDPIFDFGTGPRNAVYFNPQGNMLVLAGFGNLHGNIEVWDLSAKKLISNPKAPDCTHFEWCPDGQHILTSTVSPRLRVGNGYQVWHYTGTLLHDTKVGTDQELWQALWQPALQGSYPEPKISYKAVATTAEMPVQPQAEAKAYVPPHLRNNPQGQAAKAKAPKFREEYEKPSNQKQEGPEKMSKAAMKNKKRREAKLAKATEGAATPVPAPAQAPGSAQGRGSAPGSAQARGPAPGSAQGRGRGSAPGSAQARGPAPGSAQGRGSGSGSGKAPGSAKAQAPPAKQEAAQAPGGPASNLSEDEKKARNLRKKLQQIQKLKDLQAGGKQLEANQLEKIRAESGLQKELSKLSI